MHKKLAEAVSMLCAAGAVGVFVAVAPIGAADAGTGPSAPVAPLPSPGTAWVTGATPGGGMQTTTVTVPTTTVAPTLGPGEQGPSSTLSGMVTVALYPTQQAGPPSQTPTAASPDSSTILCGAALGNHVHWSVKGHDTSWHWSWGCDEAQATPVTAKGTSVVATNNLVLFARPFDQHGFSGQVNPRQDTCYNRTMLYGYASIHFSAPDHTPATVKGSSPAALEKC